MEKEEALNIFLLGFKASLNLAALYSPQHLFFLKSVEELKQKADTALELAGVIRIDVDVSKIFLNSTLLKDSLLTQEFADSLHLRKIKNITIRPKVKFEELSFVIGSLSYRAKQVLRQGGINKMLAENKPENIIIEELDYSQYLKSEGEEIKDVWGFLLKEAVEERDNYKISVLADNFPRIIAKFKAKELVSDHELVKNISNFLQYLKENQNEKFIRCIQELAKVIIQDRAFMDYESSEIFKKFFKELKGDAVADTLLEQLSTSIDNINLGIFFRILDMQQHEEAAESLSLKLKSTEYLTSKGGVRKKIKKIFFEQENPFSSEVYRKTLNFLMSDIAFSDSFNFDHNMVNTHYQMALLNLLEQENEKNKLTLISKRIFGAWEKIIAGGDWEYLRCLIEVLKNKTAADKGSQEYFEELNLKITEFTEEIIWEPQQEKDISFLANYIRFSIKGPHYYLDKFFADKNVNPYVLTVFLKLFPDKISNLYDRLKNELADIKFMFLFLECLKSVKSSLAVDVLKQIFNLSSEMIKIEVLKEMGEMSGFDAGFLFPVLSSKNLELKRGAVVILARDKTCKQRAFEELFISAGFFGFKNQALLENIDLVDELNLRETKNYIAGLAKKRFIWNRRLRKKAQALLDKWHD